MKSPGWTEGSAVIVCITLLHLQAIVFGWWLCDWMLKEESAANWLYRKIRGWLKKEKK